jgi:hypothetical protein
MTAAKTNLLIYKHFRHRQSLLLDPVNVLDSRDLNGWLLNEYVHDLDAHFDMFTRASKAPSAIIRGPGLIVWTFHVFENEAEWNLRSRTSASDPSAATIAARVFP